MLLSANLKFRSKIHKKRYYIKKFIIKKYCVMHFAEKSKITYLTIKCDASSPKLKKVMFKNDML